MLFMTHLLLGIVFFLVLKGWIGSSVTVFLLVLLGSILPDIDVAHSKINQWSGILGKWVAFFSKHRGVYHSLFLAVVLLSGLGYFWRWDYGLAFFIGYLAHLLGDGITIQGVQLFYPFSDWKIKGPIKTGGVLEMVLFLVMVVLVVKTLF